jgi:NifU-like protein involved in Fe-S cluster formation
MLALAADLARYPLAGDFAAGAQRRSSVCGSTLAIGLDMDEAGAFARIGLKVSACAVGQSSAAILAGSARGASPESVGETLEGLRQWLEGEAPLPPWPGLEAIAAVRERQGRHGALLLPWEAAVEALSSRGAAR